MSYRFLEIALTPGPLVIYTQEGIRNPGTLVARLDEVPGYKTLTDLSVEDLENLCSAFRLTIDHLNRANKKIEEKRRKGEW